MTTSPAPRTKPYHSSGQVETYFDAGRWKTRRSDSPEPIATGDSREQLIAIGVEVARWNGLRHIIRNADGTIDEIDTYGAGPYPSRSPIRRLHPHH